MKIADFGLARDIDNNEEYVKEDGEAMPIKWTALESLLTNVYTWKSDV